jgi:spore germination cell wall hydrolase CwlJ-like protein
MKRKNFARILAISQLVFILYTLSLSCEIFQCNLKETINQSMKDIKDIPNLIPGDVNSIKPQTKLTKYACKSVNQADSLTTLNKNDDEKSSKNHVDKYILMKIAMAEAEGEGVEGKALVMLVVLNRVEHNSFPHSIKKVVFQKRQFSPISNGRYDKVEPDSDCLKAYNKVKNGWDESRGALYFTSEKGNETWHHRNLEYLFTYGNHRFYK